MEISLNPSHRNPRAIWCRLDELTEPSPDVPDFYEELGEKLITFAGTAGIPSKKLEAVRAQLPTLATQMSQNLTQAAVREFIKHTAAVFFASTKTMSETTDIPIQDLRDAWLNLAAHGTPPASEIAGRVLPAWSVSLDAWLDRLTKVYLRDYSRRNAHFKLAIAPYGGGKTHFLLRLRHWRDSGELGDMLPPVQGQRLARRLVRPL